jgi:hypothetical protein
MRGNKSMTRDRHRDRHDPKAVEAVEDADQRTSTERVIDTAFESLIREYVDVARGTPVGSPEWNFLELLNHVYGKVLTDREERAQAVSADPPV